MLFLTLTGCDQNPLVETPATPAAPTGPSFTGSINNEGTTSVGSLRVGIFQNDSTPLFNENNDLGKIVPAASLTPHRLGVIAGSAYTATYPVLTELSTASGSTWNLVAWNDANSNGLLDTDEYNSMPTVNAECGNAGDPQDYFFSSIAYYGEPDLGTAGYRFKYYSVAGDGSDVYKQVDPASLTSTDGFNFKLNF